MLRRQVLGHYWLATLAVSLNMAGRTTREGRTIEVRHVAEVLADMTDSPAISQPEKAR